MRVEYAPSFPSQQKGVVRQALAIMRRHIAPMVDSLLFYGTEEPGALATAVVRLAYREASIGITPAFSDNGHTDGDERLRTLVHELAHILTGSQGEVLMALIERIEPEEGPGRKLLVRMAQEANEADTQAVTRLILLTEGMEP